ncbi:MAG: ABC transporter ATP-binding protein, partial [Acidimicrobiia bacterium]|nr:ABC transporter ATP-binding protein [Acidimicrobiia bacterium]
MVRCRGVTVAVEGHLLLQELDLDAHDGEWVSVIGPN